MTKHKHFVCLLVAGAGLNVREAEHGRRLEQLHSSGQTF